MLPINFLCIWLLTLNISSSLLAESPTRARRPPHIRVPMPGPRSGSGLLARETMSSGSSCSQTPSRAIPTTRRVVLGDGVQLPPGDYSTTPGGTLFSTTPGGTRIIYDRKFLMECRNSPVTKTPPRDLPTIPGVTSPVGDEPPTDASQNHLRSSPDDKPAGAGGEESQFEMDI